MDLTHVLITPVVTEKTALAEQDGVYTFVINARATKIDVKNAIKKLYGADVADVNIKVSPKKTRLVGRGRVIVKRDRLKKAMIRLQDGGRLDLNKFTKVKKSAAKKAAAK